MTLTEEQREAIRVISKLPMAIGCQLCHPYIMENYGSHFIVLRDMIDSSGTVEPTGGFDLEMARAEVATASARMLSESREQARIFCAEEILPDALDEIERLRADNAGLSKTVIDIQEERDLAQAEFRAYHKAWEEQAARIKELEDALVEGLTNFLHYRASCYDPARRCPYAKECDDCSTWDACGHVEMFRSEARRQLQAEGEIGPDAHLRPYEVVAADLAGRLAEDRRKSWQITEERVDAIESAVVYAREILTDGEKAVLRTMLVEARP